MRRRRETINSRSKCFSSPWAAERERRCNQQRHCLLAKPSHGGMGGLQALGRLVLVLLTAYLKLEREIKANDVKQQAGLYHGLSQNSTESLTFKRFI